jgi:tetratricopeptide (TPR) repeat protein
VVAKVNPVKLKQEAEKLEKAGRSDQAIALYKQIIDDNPRDWNVINKVGDLYAKLNRTREAADEYAKVADFYARDGFLLKAIAIWKKINKLDASALEPYQQLAELYAKQGLLMEAKAQYQIVIDEFIKRGRTRDAGEVLRKMAEVDPSDLKVRSKLADLYTREGSAEKAVGEHIAIAEELNKKGHLAEALQVLEKGLKIDPKSDRLRLELARVHLIQKNYDKAAQYLEEAVQHSHSDPLLLARLGEAYLGGRKIEEAEAIFKRLLEINPGDDDARAQMGRVFLLQERFDDAFRELQPSLERLLSRRDGDRAAALLQQITQRNPQHVASLAKLAEIHRTFQKESALSATLSQLTEALIAQGDLDQAAEALEELVQREPQNQQHRNKLEFVRKKLTGAGPRAARTAAAPAPALEFEEEDFEVSPPAPEPKAPARAAPPPREAARPAAPAPAPPPPAAAPARAKLEPAGPLTDEDREFIDEHIAEGRVFRKYGLVAKAIDQFQAVIARYPDNLDARKELRDAYRDDGKPAQVAEQCLALAEIYRLKGDETNAQAQEEEAARLAPSPARPAAPAPASAAAPAAAPAAKAAAPAPAKAAPPPPIPEPEPALDLGLDAEEEEIALDGDQEDVPLALSEEEDIALDAESEPPLSMTSEPGLLELDEDGGGQELADQFLDEEPALVDDADLSLPEPEPLPVTPEPEPAPDFADTEFAAGEEELTFQEQDLSLSEPDFVPPESADEEAPLLTDDEGFPDAIPADPVAASPAGGGDFSLDLDEELALDVEEAAPPVFTPPPAEPPPAPPSRAAAPAAPAGLLRVLEEVEQYMSLGFVDDARDALRDLVARHPNHPAIMAKLDELGMDLDVPEEAPAAAPELADELLGGGEEEVEVAFEEDEEEVRPEPAPVARSQAAPSRDEEPEEEAEVALGADLDQDVLASATGPADSGIDLAAELDDLFSAQAAVEEPQPEAVSTELGDSGLAEIFKEFKKGVDKQLGQEDYDTRYNLGIAYKEMGLIDEAIAEFQLAAKDERRLLECSSMLGICFLEKGMPKLAIKWFEKGLRAPGRTDEEYQGLRYDLASAHEAAGDVTAALNLFTELYGQDATFRDVAAKVRELRAQA